MNSYLTLEAQANMLKYLGKEIDRLNKELAKYYKAYDFVAECGNVETTSTHDDFNEESVYTHRLPGGYEVVQICNNDTLDKEVSRVIRSNHPTMKVGDYPWDYDGPMTWFPDSNTLSDMLEQKFDIEF